MKVQEVMTVSPRTCRSAETLVDAARILWDRDCGVVPVVDAGGRPVGIVTDRDCCMAALTRGRRLDEVAVGSAMATVLTTVRADAPVEDAIRLMRDKQVRRLPVVDASGRLCGLLSLADVARTVGSGLAAAPLVEALQAITSPRRGAPATRSAGADPTEGKAAIVPTVPATRGVPEPAKKSRARSKKK